MTRSESSARTQALISSRSLQFPRFAREGTCGGGVRVLGANHNRVISRTKKRSDHPTAHATSRPRSQALPLCWEPARMRDEDRFSAFASSSCHKRTGRITQTHALPCEAGTGRQGGRFTVRISPTSKQETVYTFQHFSSGPSVPYTGSHSGRGTFPTASALRLVLDSIGVFI